MHIKISTQWGIHGIGSYYVVLLSDSEFSQGYLPLNLSLFLSSHCSRRETQVE